MTTRSASQWILKAAAATGRSGSGTAGAGAAEKAGKASITSSAIHVNGSKLPHELLKSSAAYLSSAPSGGKHALPDLPYDYNALEGVISAETMELHHSKHHNTYVTNLNVALEKLDSAVSAADVSAIIALQGALKFNGGGHLNHSLFWNNLTPTSTSGGPGTVLTKQLEQDFGSVDAMKESMSATTIAIQGSGWGWLGYDSKSDSIQVATCANQDPLQATTGLVPLLGIDVWEHAYYVDYRNVRPNYVKAIWDIIDWKTVEQRLMDAKK